MARSALATKPDSVLVKNVYYLMAYAFDAIDIRAYRQLEFEQFESMDDLLAAILLLGLESQRRRGFEKEYQSRRDESWHPKGHIDAYQTMCLQLQGKLSAAYEFDEYTENTLFNQILKTCALLLAGNSEVSVIRRRRLRDALVYLQNVSTIVDVSRIAWRRLQFHRSTRSYLLLMGICRLIIQRELMSSHVGDAHFALFDDKQAFSTLFEKFIFKYYKRHFPQLQPQSQQMIKPEAGTPTFLPSMRQDVTLSIGNKTLILDAKCYGTIFAMRFDERKLSAEHIRQIYYYASHTGTPENVAALLVYAGTNEPLSNDMWRDQGYALGCVTLNLNQPFSDICAELNNIVDAFAKW